MNLISKLLQANKETVVKYEEAMDDMQFSVALSTIWQLVSRTNKYIDETQPWALAKDEAKVDELASVMVHLAESLRRVAIMLKPFLTVTPEKIFEQLDCQDPLLQSWDSLKEFGLISENSTVKKGQPIFPRLDMEEEVTYIKEAMQSTAPLHRSKKRKRKSNNLQR